MHYLCQSLVKRRLSPYLQLIQTSRAMIFTGELDRYKGLHIKLGHETIVSAQEFEASLKESLEEWIQKQYRVSWFQIGLQLTQYIPSLVKFGYVFHHSKPDYVVMNKWLSNEPKNIPDYAHTNIGVGGLVVDDKDRVLVVKEKHFFGPQQIWKFPGGYAIQGEDFGQTAVREVLEETGIECEFQSVIAFRHIHRFAFDCSDVYIVCHLKPKAGSDSDGSDGSGLVVKKCAYEIDDCTWMSIPELKPQLTQFNAHILEKFLSYREMGVKIGLESIPAIIRNIDQQTYSIHKVL